MVYFTTTSRSASEVAVECSTNGVKMLPMGPNTIRLVFHLGVPSEDVDRIIKVIGEAAR